MNLAFGVFQHSSLNDQDENKKITNSIFKYILKVASLDENLIVKQKARFMGHIFEYSRDLDLTKFTATTDSQEN